jgi:hypothetical protein
MAIKGYLKTPLAGPDYAPAPIPALDPRSSAGSIGQASVTGTQQNLGTVAAGAYYVIADLNTKVWLNPDGAAGDLGSSEFMPVWEKSAMPIYLPEDVDVDVVSYDGASTGAIHFVRMREVE